MQNSERARDRVASLAKAARGIISEPARATVISPAHPLPEIPRAEAGVDPGLDLFHFGLSICSQKVRAVLAELKLTYGSNQVDLRAFENYAPEYVRLRLQSDAAKTSEPASSWSGATAVDRSGFDALVVPTLVDNSAGRVVADSKQICLYLARSHREETDLVPADIADAIVAQMDLVDQTPHAALLYCPNPDGDRRPPPIRQMTSGSHQPRIDAIRSRMALVAGEPELVTAYEHKIMKEEAASGFASDEDAVRQSITLTRDITQPLAERLNGSDGQWVFGHRFTLADLMWAVSLNRLEFLGYDWLWTGDAAHPDIKDYLVRVKERLSIKTAVLGWP